MTNQKSKICLGLFLVLLFVSVFCFHATQRQVKAESCAEEAAFGVDSVESADGIYTSLSLSINGGDGMVWATVKNDVTVFPATVIVIVELYCSVNYEESYSDMTMVARNYTADLDMGDTIVAEYSTGGVQQYWQARMRYKIDKNEWEAKQTGTCLYSADGTFLGY